jgi:anti-sigma regulatory factor (Ser/Thr protein kinase)
VSDEIRLTLPRDRDFYGIAHLVVGGLAVRLNLTYESLEDLQLALEELLTEDEDEGADVTVAVRLENGTIHAAVGPFDADTLRHELDREREGGLGLRLVLDAVCDEVRVGERADGHWVEFEKRVEIAKDGA